MRFDSAKPCAETIEELLREIVTASSFELSYTIVGDLRRGVVSDAEIPQSQPASGQLAVTFTGPDTPLLVARNGELLNAFEHVAAKVLRLEPEDHDRLCFDANSFKANRDQELRLSASRAVETVRSSGRPFSFPPMTSRERRFLHVVLKDSGLQTSSSGENPRRFVVLYPEKQTTSELAYASAAPDRTDAVRSSFRRRQS